MLIDPNMSLSMLGQESNLDGSLPCVRRFRDLIVNEWRGQETGAMWRMQQRRWLAMWDEAIGAEPSAPPPPQPTATKKGPPPVETQLLLEI